MSKQLELARELVKILEEKENTQVCEPACYSDKVELATLYPGEVFKIGEHDFIVLEQSEGQTSVISKGFMSEDIVFDRTSIDYNSSNLKNVIESDIQPIIENAVGKENLVEHIVDLTSIDMQKNFEPCKCKVRPITFDESRKYNNFLVDENLDDWWWTCTPWSTKERGYQYSIAVVSPSGDVGSGNYYNDVGVRPFCIFSSSIFESKVRDAGQ